MGRKRPPNKIWCQFSAGGVCETDSVVGPCAEVASLMVIYWPKLLEWGTQVVEDEFLVCATDDVRRADEVVRSRSCEHPVSDIG